MQLPTSLQPVVSQIKPAARILLILIFLSDLSIKDMIVKLKGTSRSS